MKILGWTDEELAVATSIANKMPTPPLSPTAPSGRLIRTMRS
jgi:hypothetical protein